jgi:hypothetical protein
MALTIETGLGVIGATSYVTLVEARAFATSRGITLPAADADLEVLLTKSMDYLEGLRYRFKGSRTFGLDGTGPYLQWPRTGVNIDGVDIATTTIPKELKSVQCQLAIEFMTLDVMATQSGQVVRRERVDVIETEYAVGTRSTTERIPRPFMPRVDALLRPLVNNVGLTVSRA